MDYVLCIVASLAVLAPFASSQDDAPIEPLFQDAPTDAMRAAALWTAPQDTAPLRAPRGALGSTGAGAPMEPLIQGTLSSSMGPVALEYERVPALVPQSLHPV